MSSSQAVPDPGAKTFDPKPFDLKVIIENLSLSAEQLSGKEIDELVLMLCKLLETRRDDKITKITATNTTVTKMCEVFGLQTTNSVWKLTEDKRIKAPSKLTRNLNDLIMADYDPESEAYCRISIDLILIQCRIQVKKNLNAATNITAPLNTPSTPPKGTSDMPKSTPQKLALVYAESNISTRVSDSSNPKNIFHVIGRADWTMGYSSNPNDGALLVALEAKKRSEFSSGESQLVTYLAILRENRRKAGKINAVTQGFYSDGDRFEFVCLRDNGDISKSRTYNISDPEELDLVFSFITAMLETALKSSPTTTPTKPGRLKDQEINDYDTEVWSAVYELVHRMKISDVRMTEADENDKV